MSMELWKTAKVIHNFLENPENEESLNFLVCDAFDGGIGYWAGLDNTTAEYARAKHELVLLGRKAICMEDIITQMLLNGDMVILYDIEDENEIYKLNLGKLANGVAMFLEADADNEGIFSNLREDLETLFEELDSSDADCIVQYALFNDIIFG